MQEGDHLIGVVGATTPTLPFISSPRNVEVRENVAETVRRQVDRLECLGVNIVVMITQLQSIEEDLALAPLLSGVDVMIAERRPPRFAPSGRRRPRLPAGP